MKSAADMDQLADADELLEATFENWKKDREQVDDVLVVGIRF